MPVDYSKWDHIQLSDDDDEDCHPNIEKYTWRRLKAQKREQEKMEAEAKHQKLVQDYQETGKMISEYESNLPTLTPEEQEVLKQKLSELRQQEASLKKKIEEDEERQHKLEKWGVESLKDGFSKTIINKANNSSPSTPAAPSSFPSPSTTSSSSTSSTSSSSATSTSSTNSVSSSPTASSSTAVETADSMSPLSAHSSPPSDMHTQQQDHVPETRVPGAAMVLTENKKDMSEEAIEAYVRDMEIKAHKFANARNYEEYYQILQQHPDLLCKETNEYLLLHVSDFIKKSRYDISKKYLIGACIIQYSLELGKDGVHLFFYRIRDPNKPIKQEFERETLAYWERIKEKILELQKQRQAEEAAKEKHQGETEESDEEEYTDAPDEPVHISQDVD